MQWNSDTRLLTVTEPKGTGLAALMAEMQNTQKPFFTPCVASRAFRLQECCPVQPWRDGKRSAQGNGFKTDQTGNRESTSQLLHMMTCIEIRH